MSDTPIADMVEQMLAHGSLPAMIVLAVRTIELDRVSRETSARVGRFVGRLSDDASADCQTTSADRRRERDRIYQRKRRENQRGTGISAKANDVAEMGPLSDDRLPMRLPTGVDESADASLQRCDSIHRKDSKLEERKKASEKEVVVVERAKRGKRIPDDWSPSDADRQFAIDHRVDPDRLAAEFKDYWASTPGQRGTKLDWSATWRNNVRRVAGGRNMQSAQPTFQEIAEELRRKQHAPAQP